MHAKIQGLRDGVDYNRETLATVSRQLRLIYDADISRPLPGHFARLLNELGPDSLSIIVRRKRADADARRSFRSVGMQAIGQHATPVLTG